MRQQLADLLGPQPLDPAELVGQGRPIDCIEHDRPIEQLPLQLVRRPDHRDPAVVDDADPIGLLRLLEVVGREEDRRPVGVADLAEVVPQGAAADRVETRGRLVEEQDPGPVHEAADDLELPLHPAGKRLEGLEEVVVEPNDVGQQLDPLAVLRRHQAIERAVAVKAVDRDVETDVLLAREVLVDARVLEDDPDVATDGRRVPVEVVAGDRDRPARLAERRRQDRDRRRLARPVRAEEGEQLTRSYVEADVVDGRLGRLPVTLDEVLDANDRFHRDSTRVTGRWRGVS